jgi:hypothetical protein
MKRSTKGESARAGSKPGVLGLAQETHYPGIGDHPHPASPSSGVCSTSRGPGPPAPRDSRMRRYPLQRGPRGEVRAATASFAPLPLCNPVCNRPPQLSPTGRPEALAPGTPCNVSVTPPHPPVQTAPCRTMPGGAPGTPRAPLTRWPPPGGAGALRRMVRA